MPLQRHCCPHCAYWVDADTDLVAATGAPFCPSHAVAMRCAGATPIAAHARPAPPGQRDIADAPSVFRLDLLRATMDLSALADALGNTSHGEPVRLLLSGPPGTGKSEFARFLAQRMGYPANLVAYSDIVSHYVGQTEKQIRTLFDEAKANGTFLIFDEADSILRSRAVSQHSWEATQVNEMLQQLDRTAVPVAFTTNDLPGIDAAVMRRIDLKIVFLPLDRAGLRAAFTHFFQQAAPTSLDRLGDLELALGDFRTVARRSRLLGYGQDAERLVRELENEASFKPAADRHRKVIGFQTGRNHADPVQHAMAVMTT